MAARCCTQSPMRRPPRAARRERYGRVVDAAQSGPVKMPQVALIERPLPPYSPTMAAESYRASEDYHDAQLDEGVAISEKVMFQRGDARYPTMSKQFTKNTALSPMRSIRDRASGPAAAVRPTRSAKANGLHAAVPTRSHRISTLTRRLAVCRARRRRRRSGAAIRQRCSTCTPVRQSSIRRRHRRTALGEACRADRPRLRTRHDR
jgi:hypothetical protein